MKKLFIPVLTTIIIILFGLVGCKEDDKVGGNNLVNTTWIAYVDLDIAKLNFVNKDALIVSMEIYGSGGYHTVSYTGIYTKNGNTVNMTIRGDLLVGGQATWIGTIDGTTMTVEINGHTVIFIKE